MSNLLCEISSICWLYGCGSNKNSNIMSDSSMDKEKKEQKTNLQL